MRGLDALRAREEGRRIAARLSRVGEEGANLSILMASQTTLVDNAESGSDLDPLLDTQETPGQSTDAAAHPSARALYVPSPLPMAELKQQLARAAQEEAASASPTQRPPPPNAAPDVMVHALPDPPLARIELEPPPPGFEKAIDRRLVSCLDSDEANAKRTFPIVANPVPTPGLQAIAQPIVPSLQPTAPIKPRSHKLRNAVLFALALGLGVMALGILHGDLTKADARNAISTLGSAAQHVAARVK